MESTASPDESNSPKRRRLYFSLGGLLFLVLGFAMVFAGYRAGFDTGYSAGFVQYQIDHPYSKVYSVADLINPRSTQQDFNSLVDLITATIQPSSWKHLGGTGDITVFRSNLSLVVYHSSDAHAEIDKLLGQLRDLRKQAARQ